MKRLSWVKFYMTDWMIGVRRMSWAARGIYMEALALQFHGERLDVGLEAWQELFPGITEADYWQVVRHFEEREDERGAYFVNRRLEAEMDASKVKSEKARESAKRSHSGRSANALRTQSERSAIRGEERREEEKRINDSDYRPTEVVEQAPRKRGRPADPLVWSWESGFTGITGDDIARWKDAYGQIDVDSEIKQADEHVRAYPEKQHMKRWRRFLTDWLARSNRWAIERAKRGNEAPARSGAPKRSRAHIPEDAHPDDEHLWFMTNGWTPRQIPIYRTRDGRERWMNGDYIDETPSQGDSNENDE